MAPKQELSSWRFAGGKPQYSRNKPQGTGE